MAVAWNNGFIFQRLSLFFYIAFPPFHFTTTICKWINTISIFLPLPFFFGLDLIFHVIDGNIYLLGFVWVCKLVGRKKRKMQQYDFFFHKKSKLHSHLGLFLCFGVKIRICFLVATSFKHSLVTIMPISKTHFDLDYHGWIFLKFSMLGLLNLVALLEQLNICFSCTLKMWGLSI